MKFDEMLEIRPAYVPSGYRFRRSLHGKIFDGFDSELDQVMLIYGAGWTDEAATRPLRVYIGPSNGGTVLFGTEEQRGQELDIGIVGARTNYHEGRWALGPGIDTRPAGDVVVHWDTSDDHSLTVIYNGLVYAVRGSRLNGVTLDELVKVAKSLPY
jgi:hypothetical protein